MPELKAFHQPRSISEAVSLLEEYGDRARVVAGGTAVALSRSTRLEVLVDLSRLGINKLEESTDGLRLGAMVTCSQLRRFLAGRPASALSEAASGVGSRILQNQVTVGGNCVMVYAWSDLPVALWCLGASFLVQGSGRREICADDFFAEHPSRVIGTGELLVEVRVPPCPAGSGSAYLKFGRNATDQAVASVAVQVSQSQGKLTGARITVGAVRGLPQMLAGTAGSLVGKQPSPEALQQAGALAGDEAKITADFHGGADHRRQLVCSLVEDALAAAVSRAGGAS